MSITCGRVIWITGLSAAGKTTLGALTVSALRERGYPSVLMDGDDLRKALSSTTDHSLQGRLELALKYSQLAALLANQGIHVVVSTVALFHVVHDWNRKNLPAYFEVYLKVPISELRRRDPKGIYARFDRGELKNVAGLDVLIEEPLHPDLVLDHNLGLGPEKGLVRLLDALNI